MKKRIAILLCAVAIATAGCGGASQSGASTTQEVVEESPTDLTGTWKSEDNNGTYMEATISSDSIQIDWVSDEGNTRAIYWVGTYVAPSEKVSTYTWTSEGDVEQMSTAIMASSDASKDFTYSEDAINYEVTAMGVTQTTSLKKSE